MLIVQKYGGTSVGSIERIEAVADRIARTVRAGHQVAVVVSAMGHTTDELVSLAHAIDPDPDGREMDALLSTGEQVSAALVAMALQKRGLGARSLTGWQAGIHTERVYGAARMLNIETKVLREALEQGIIPVITGFQGIAGDDVTTLGRGGSDTTAVAVAAVLKADVCEIYTDVTGVFTTDPRVVPTARKLTEVSYDEMLELANLGAQVLHPRAVENAKQFEVKLVVRSSFTEEEGTYVVETPVGFEKRNVVTGIAFEREVARIALVGVPLQRHGLASVFGTLAERNVNVDVIVQSVVQQAGVDVSFTVKEEDSERAMRILRDLQTDLGYRDLVREDGLAKVSIVGAGMISNPGVAAHMFQVLADADIPIKMVSTSEIKVSCIIAAAELERAVKALHEAFIETE
ncbi:MAG: aspartate kinase [Alicyclobacillus macrosporangiidus]|uniref:aspartate kinase n=1 Tax=Alicyclobacillus macrosporangiidus TaxID=392015 RepID=UPI0026E9CD43|nr:aspartate kinase [Alicyclobacillus macrosporangiidus]MCL6597637.1 aspartate kinase [Alicyclobacillus macrosporangiidus]